MLGLFQTKFYSQFEREKSEKNAFFKNCLGPKEIMRLYFSPFSRCELLPYPASSENSSERYFIAYMWL